MACLQNELNIWNTMSAKLTMMFAMLNVLAENQVEGVLLKVKF